MVVVEGVKGGRKFSIIKHWKRQRSWSLGGCVGDKELGLISGCDRWVMVGFGCWVVCGMCFCRPWISWEYC